MDFGGQIEIAKLMASGVGLVGGGLTAYLAYKSFKRNEIWRSSEFLGKWMNEFWGQQKVANAKVLIDWGVRRVPLLKPIGPDEAGVIVTRAIQVRALRPHIFLTGIDSEGEMAAEEVEGYREKFTPEEAAIRDCYDAFLDGLELLSSFVATRIVAIKQLQPYIKYWLSEIASPATNSPDAAWAASLLTYITFYNFLGVVELFRLFNLDISPTSSAYHTFLRQMDDQNYAGRLAGSVGVVYNSDRACDKNPS